MSRSDKLTTGTPVFVSTWGGQVIAEGVVTFDSTEYVSLHSCRPLNGSDRLLGDEAVLAHRYYAVEAKEAEGEQTTVNQPADAGGMPPGGASPGAPNDDVAAAMMMATPKPPKPKSSLSDDDVERLLMKVGETALSGLKGMGLKSGAIYPMMIKLNAAVKSALSTTQRDD
jgi:hypothetical protein